MVLLLQVYAAYGAFSIRPAKARRLVTLLYRGILMRDPDQGGLDYWSLQVSQGGYAGLIQVAGAIAMSDEYKFEIEPYLDPREILTNIYRVFFSRPVDPVGLRAWLPLLSNGESGRALRGIVSSEEFYSIYIAN